MLYQAKEEKYWDIEIWIAKLYLYLLPIRMIAPLIFLKQLLPGGAMYFDFVLHALGIFILVLRTRGMIKLENGSSMQVLLHFIKLIVYLNLSSIVMSIFIQLTIGDYAGESAFSGIFGMFIYFTQYAVILFYNKYVFEILSKDEILTILHRVCWFLLILGYWQVAAMSFGGIFSALHDSLDVFDVLYSAETMPKLCLTGSEGASAGGIISIFVLPILYSCIISENKKKSSVVQAILWLVPLFFTRSSTAYILFAAVTISFLAIYLFNTRHKIGAIAFLVILVLLFSLLIIVWFDISILPEDITYQIKYLLFEKATDANNGSTIARTVPLIVNWKTFLRYPLFGVGNGLQGYFYVEFFPEFATNIEGSDVFVFYERAKTGISNGGVFFPSLLSGYGIVGILLIAIFVFRLIRHARAEKKQMEEFYYAFLLASIGVLISGFQGDMYGQYYSWFMLSLPLMIREKILQA